MAEENIVETVRSNSSGALNELVTALATAELEFKPIIKNRFNKYYNSKYADLESIISAVREPLAKHGLVIVQSPTVDIENKKVFVTTTLLHKSGQWLESTISAPGEQKGKEGLRFDAPSIGIATTYLRRYGISATLNIAADEDDDGNKLTEEPKQPAQAKSLLSEVTKDIGSTVANPNLPTKEERDVFGKKLKEFKIDGRTLKAFVYRQTKVSDPDGWEKITTPQWEAVIQSIEKAVSIGPEELDKLLGRF